LVTSFDKRINKVKTIRDLLYFDFEKAASIFSQFDEGWLEQESVTEDSSKGQGAGVRLGIPNVAEAKLGAEYLQKRSTLRSRTLHHNLLNLVEDRLAESDLVADLSSIGLDASHDGSAVRSVIGNSPYLRAQGDSVIEDYRRILAISGKFNQFVDFFAKSTEQTAKASPAYLALKAKLDADLASLKNIPDRNERAAKKHTLDGLQDALNDLTKSNVAKLDPWLVEGIRLFIETYMPSRINFRIYPFSDCSSFQVLCNLKPECFVDSDLEHLLYGYGSRPNVPLSVFGLITSLPSENARTFDPLREFAEDPKLAESSAFEKGFRGMFSAMEVLEAMARFSRYPNVTVHPIAVYRSLSPAKT